MPADQPQGASPRFTRKPRIAALAARPEDVSNRRVLAGEKAADGVEPRKFGKINGTRLDPQLDMYRFMVKNTHELNILPDPGRFYRPNALACGSARN